MSYAKGKYAFGFCDKTGFRYPLNELVDEFKNGTRTGFRVGPDVKDPDHPQNFLGRVKINDPQSLMNARPDTRAEPATARALGANPFFTDEDFPFTGGTSTIEEAVLDAALNRDATAVLRFVTAEAVTGRPLGDITGDGNVRSFDALTIGRYADGQFDEIDVEYYNYIKNVMIPYMLENNDDYSSYYRIPTITVTEPNHSRSGTVRFYGAEAFAGVSSDFLNRESGHAITGQTASTYKISLPTNPAATNPNESGGGGNVYAGPATETP